MSIPFSNTHYRIPQGFATLLEGLTREILRDQPNDIPLFAAKYFAKLLKDREESGFDPAEWGAALEDRFYNDHSFQHAEDNLFRTCTDDVEGPKESITTMDTAKEISEPQEVSTSLQHSLEKAYELAEDSKSTTQAEDESDGALIRESSADPDAPRLAEEDQNVLLPDPNAPAYPPLAEVDQKNDEQYTLLQDQAATVIQAAIRGHLVRREVKNLRAEKAGDKSDLPEPSDQTSEQISDIQNFEQEGKDSDFTEQLKTQRVVSTETSQDIFGLEEPHEDTDIKEEKVVPSDTDLQEQQASVATETFLMEMAENKQETVDNMVVAEGEVVHDSDKDDVRPPEAREHKAVEQSASREEMFTGLEPRQQIHNEDLVEEQKEFEALTTSTGQHPVETTEQSNREDVNSYKTETTGHPAIEDFSDQLAETMEQPGTEDTSDHITEEDTNDNTTKQPVTEGGSDHTTEQPDNEDTSDHTTEEPVTKDTSAHTIEHPIAENTSDHTAKTTVDQQDPGEKNETCRKHQEEVLDIALDDPDANAAAAKIQAGFRGHMTRKKMKGSDKDLKHKDGKEGSSAEGSRES